MHAEEMKKHSGHFQRSTRKDAEKGVFFLSSGSSRAVGYDRLTEIIMAENGVV